MKIITKKYIVKTWDELTEEEKKEKINKNWEDIAIEWDNREWGIAVNRINNLKNELKIIGFNGEVFDTFYFADNSQGWWIDKIITKKIYANCDTFDFNEVDFEFGRCNQSLKNIEDIDTNCIGCYCYFNAFQTDFENDYYTYNDLELMANFKNSNDELEYKEFNQAWNEFKKEYNYFVSEFNSIVQDYFDYRYDISDDFIEEYFDGAEFEFLSEVKENEN